MLHTWLWICSRVSCEHSEHSKSCFARGQCPLLGRYCRFEWECDTRGSMKWKVPGGATWQHHVTSATLDQSCFWQINQVGLQECKLQEKVGTGIQHSGGQHICLPREKVTPILSPLTPTSNRRCKTQNSPQTNSKIGKEGRVGEESASSQNS